MIVIVISDLSEYQLFRFVLQLGQEIIVIKQFNVWFSFFYSYLPLTILQYVDSCTDL